MVMKCMFRDVLNVGIKPDYQSSQQRCYHYDIDVIQKTKRYLGLIIVIKKMLAAKSLQTQFLFYSA